MSKNLVSIVIVNFNGMEFVDNCLQSVLKSTYPHLEVIVVDNNSTDQSAKTLDKYRTDTRFKLIHLDENLHYAGGNNVGIRNSKGEFLLFLNMDTTMGQDCLEKLVQSFRANQNVSAIQCLVSDMADANNVFCGGTIDFCGRLLPVSLLWAENENARTDARLFWAHGAALAIRREVLDDVGSFDTEMPTDEVDMCWRINLAGGKIVLCPEGLVRHFGSASFGKDLKKERLYLGELARLSCILKNYESANIVKLSPYFASYFFISIGWDTIFRRRADILFFRLKAYAHILLHIKPIFAKRSIVQKRVRKISDAEIMKLIVRPNPYYYIKI